MSNHEIRLIPQRVANSELVAPLVYSVSDTGRLLGGMSPRTVEKLIARGELEAIGQRKLRRVIYASIVAYIERSRSEA